MYDDSFSVDFTKDLIRIYQKNATHGTFDH